MVAVQFNLAVAHLMWSALYLCMPLPVFSEEAPSFTRDIKRLLSDRCIRCHGPDAEARHGGGEHGLRLDIFEGATEDLGGYAAIVSGDAQESELVIRISEEDADLVMPPPEAGDPLSADEVALLQRWIDDGAEVRTTLVIHSLLVVQRFQLSLIRRGQGIKSIGLSLQSLKQKVLNQAEKLTE